MEKLERQLLAMILNADQNQATPDDRDLGKCIVVAQRGFVMMGKTRYEGDDVVVTDCVNVRRWGTKRGLGQLASEGPTNETVLDPQPETRVHRLAVVEIIRCAK